MSKWDRVHPKRDSHGGGGNRKLQNSKNTKTESHSTSKKTRDGLKWHRTKQNAQTTNKITQTNSRSNSVNTEKGREQPFQQAQIHLFAKQKQQLLWIASFRWPDLCCPKQSLNGPARRHAQRQRLRSESERKDSLSFLSPPLFPRDDDDGADSGIISSGETNTRRSFKRSLQRRNNLFGKGQATRSA